MKQQNKKVTSLKETIRNRRAVKKGYTNKEVTEELVKELLSDATWAPTHGMREPWRFVFVHQDRLPTFWRQFLVSSSGRSFERSSGQRIRCVSL